MKLEHSNILGMFFKIVEHQLLNDGLESYGTDRYFDKNNKHIKNSCTIYNAIKTAEELVNKIMRLTKMNWNSGDGLYKILPGTLDFA